ncbi:alpha-amylase [Streptomyces sp. NPDC020801]|uniref:alpha-amylase n=1 Tax=unclassified Streptomyces TaxID=2593676 RepID=UPI00379EF1E5
MRAHLIRLIACAGSTAALILSPSLTGSARAAPAAVVPAPPCVALYESWRYTAAGNNCATTMTVKVVYVDGAEGLCYTLPPGETTTVGEGYLGQHGHADVLALCQ